MVITAHIAEEQKRRVASSSAIKMVREKKEKRVFDKRTAGKLAQEVLSFAKLSLLISFMMWHKKEEVNLTQMTTKMGRR